MRQRFDRLPDICRLLAPDDVLNVLQVGVRAGDEDFFRIRQLFQVQRRDHSASQPAVVANEGVHAILVLHQ